MSTIPSGQHVRLDNTIVSGARAAEVSIKDPGATPSSSPISARDSVSISTLASRLVLAEDATRLSNASLSTPALRDKVTKNLQNINYPLDSANKLQKSEELPTPLDEASKASAEAANKFMDNITGPSPFAGLSREQLTTIYNDESGTFTTNEKYAAYREAYNQEISWRSAFVAKANAEYEMKGTQTQAFSAALAHYKELPLLEQVLYPDTYASNLEEKIKLDYNYFTNTAHGQTGFTADSLANLANRNRDLNSSVTIPDIFTSLQHRHQGEKS